MADDTPLVVAATEPMEDALILNVTVQVPELVLALIAVIVPDTGISTCPIISVPFDKAVPLSTAIICI
jgi:hypothetical protein